MRDFREQNYYELLEVHPKANQSELEHSYKRARKIFSHDSVATYALFQADELNMLRRRIEEAFRTLSDPERRSAYDRELENLGHYMMDEDENEQSSDESSEGEMQQSGNDELGTQTQEKEDVSSQKQAQHSDSSVASETEALPAGDMEDAKDDHLGSEAQLADDDGQEDSAEANRGAASADEESQGALYSTPASSDVSGHTDKTSEQGLESHADGARAREEQDDTGSSVQSSAQMPVLDESTEVTGALLRQARKALGLTLDDYVEKTKISIYYLRNIENEDFQDLPASVYTKGYLKQLAHILGLDPELVVKGYLERMNKNTE